MALLQRARMSGHWPSQCEVCRQWGRSALCSDCRVRYASPVPRCARCGLRMGLPTQTCVTCLREPPPFERTVCAADYGFPWDRLIADFKFNGRVDLAPMCAERLVAAVNAAANAAVEAAGGDGSAVDLVVPIPLSPARMAERGYNQAWELARRVAEGLQRPARADLLLRPADTAHQATLSRQERQRNLAQAFMVDPRRRAAVQGLRMAVVDDVMTTGATAREAALALKRAGAREVHLWMLARTPD